MNPLDNPVWNALTTAQAALAQAHGIARRYILKANDRAVKLYQRLGFRVSKDYIFVVMQKT